MIILRHGRFISGHRIFRVGEVIPDTTGAKSLVEKGMAEIIADTLTKPAKTVKKREVERAELPPKNDEVDT